MIKAETMIRSVAYYEENMFVSGDEAYCRERCKLDIYHPGGEGKVPAVVFFHGGGLQAGEKEIPAGLRNGNLAVIAPNYRLSSERAGCPDYLYDAAAAIAWTIRHAGEYGWDERAVFTCGASGGAYLAAMTALDGRYLGRFEIDVMQLAGVFPISGQMTTHFQIVNERSGKSGLGTAEHILIDEFAPIYHAKATIPPLTLLIGDSTLDWPARAEENYLLAAVLRRICNCATVRVCELAGFDHRTIYDPSLLLIREEIRKVYQESAPGAWQ